MVFAQVIGETLPLALAIAISPLSIVTVVLMLLSPRARRTSTGFLIGWVIGIAVPVMVFALVGGILPPRASPGGPDIARAVVQFVLAALMLLLAARVWRTRPKTDGEPTLPRWMSAIDSLTFFRALGVGLLLSAPRPKNLLVAAGAGVILGGAELSLSAAFAAGAVFVLCAVSTVLLPVAAFFVASERLREPLEALHRWLVRENTVITTVLLALIGVLLLGKAIGAL